MLRTRASVMPDHRVIEVDGTALTWDELDQQSMTMAGGLTSAGVGKGDVVCQMTSNSIDHVLVVFAAARLGAIECPINTGLRGKSLTHVLGHSGAKAVVVDQEFVDRLEPALSDVANAQVVVGTDDLPSGVAGRRVIPRAELEGAPITDQSVAPQDPATLIYTSGTTGPAKGVLHCQNFAFSAARAKAEAWGLSDSDVLFSPLPLFHANARYSTLLTACVINARAVIVKSFSASRFWNQVRESGATEVGTVGAVAPILLERDPSDQDRNHRVRMMHGAGALTLDQRTEFEERFGTRLVTGFSMTETSHLATVSPEDPGRYRAAGKPISEFEVEILDEVDRPTTPGVVGEIAVRPRTPFSMFLGYYRDPQATLDAFRNCWFHTGDLGFLDAEGYLHWVDRLKDAIRRKGEMISSQDVEEAARTFAGVAEAAAVGVPGDLGEEEVKLYVRAAAGESLDLIALLAHCKSRLPDFAVPRYYEMIPDFPRTSTHKIAKSELRTAGIGPHAWDAMRKG
ncbi:MAG: AMP-binding protein [Acidimicrobiia bacterium]